jgi:heptose-I-phosphate ethanolaminephosphotransferase
MSFYTTALLEAALVTFLVYGVFLAEGIKKLSSAHYGLRNLAIGIVFLFLAQISTGRFLTNAMWWGGLAAFLLTQVIYSYIQVKSSGKIGYDISQFRGFFLGYFSLGVLTALLSFFGSAYPSVKSAMAVLSFVFLMFTALALLGFIMYYVMFGVAFTSADMIATMKTSRREAKEFISSHMGAAGTLGVAAGLLISIAASVFLIQQGLGSQPDFAAGFSLADRIIQGVLVLASLITGSHWLGTIYPYHEFKVARNYIESELKAEKVHVKNVQNLEVDGSNKAEGTFILVIGESENRDQMKAFKESYPADTTPWLTAQKDNPDFYIFKHAYTNYTNTAGALSMFLTGVNQYNGNSVMDTVTIADVAKKAGYETRWISDHTPSISNVVGTVVAENADVSDWVRPAAVDDMNVMQFMKQVPEDGKSRLIIINIQGSHDKYKFRYPADFPEISVEGHSAKVNEYDTSVAYTDKVLQTVYEYARDHLNLQGMVYCSDHGEDMKYFHSASRFTWPMARVPLFAYLSESYRKAHPDVDAALRKHENTIFTNDLVFDMMCGILKTPNKYYDPKYDLASESYSLTVEDARTMHGKIKVSEDPELKEAD